MSRARAPIVTIRRVRDASDRWGRDVTLRAVLIDIKPHVAVLSIRGTLGHFARASGDGQRGPRGNPRLARSGPVVADWEGWRIVWSSAPDGLWREEAERDG